MPQTNGEPQTGARRHMLTIRLPKNVWKRLRSLATTRSHKEERNVSCNEVLIKLIREAPLR